MIRKKVNEVSGAVLQGGEKIVFANALRGIAALMVFCYHVFGLFWFARSDQHYQTGLPIPDEATYPAPGWLEFLHHSHSITWGACGVSIFFLISGFVIPFSLERHGPKGFVIGRLWRIYPTYMAGVLIGVAALFIAGAELPVAMQRPKAVLNLLPGLHNLFNAPLLDGVIWTLNVEVTFYAVILGLFLLTRGNLVRALQGMIFLGAVTALWLQSPHGILMDKKGLVNDIHFYLRHMLLILAGTTVHLHYRGKLNGSAAWLYGLACFGLFMLLWGTTPRAWFFQVFWASYTLGAVLFVGCYLGRNLPIYQSRLLRWLAQISYPLYAVHAMLCYSALTWLASHQVPQTLALIITTLLAFGVATLICRYVEMPTHRIGQSAARRCASQLTPAFKD